MELNNEFTVTVDKKNAEVSKEFNTLGYSKAKEMIEQYADSRTVKSFYFDNTYKGLIKEKFGTDLSYEDYIGNVDLVTIINKFTYVLFGSQFLDLIDVNPGYSEDQYVTAFKTIVAE